MKSTLPNILSGTLSRPLRRSGLLASASSALLLIFTTPGAAPASVPDPPAPSYGAFLGAFWEDAWDLEFEPGHSGAIVWIEASTWLIFALDDRRADAYAGQASFVESSRFEVGSDPDTFYVAGTFSTSRMEEPVVAFVRTIVADETSSAPIVVTSFVPLARPPSINRARWWAEELAALGEQGDSTAPSDPDPSIQCAAIHANCLTACRYRLSARLVDCIDSRLKCVTACVLVSTPCLFFGSPATARVCAAVCIGVCAYRTFTCMASAAYDYRICRLACDNARMACEPGWFPPYFEF